MGKSKLWPEALKKLTGSETPDVGSLKEYFEPTRKWMVKKRQEIRHTAPRWDEEDDIATKAPTDGVISLVPVLFNTFACAMVAPLAAGSFVEAVSPLRL